METYIRLKSGDILLRDIRKLAPPAPQGRGWMRVRPGLIGIEDYCPIKQTRHLIRTNGVDVVRRGATKVWPPPLH